MTDDSIGNIPENDWRRFEWSCDVGRDRNGFEDVMGIYGYGVRNANGENIPQQTSKQTAEDFKYNVEKGR